MAIYILVRELDNVIISCAELDVANSDWIEVPAVIGLGSTYVAGVVTPIPDGYYFDLSDAQVKPIPPPPTQRVLTKLQFRNRFTPAEKVAIYTAAAANVSVQIYLDDINAAEYINLDDASTAAGVAALEAAGLISVGRTAEILA